MEWKIEKVFEDLELHVRVRMSNSVVMEYEVRDLLFHDDGDWAPLKFLTEGGETTTDLEQAEMLVKGSIKWDGCSHNTFGDGNGYLHACSRMEMVRFGQLFDRLYDLAVELMSDN